MAVRLQPIQGEHATQHPTPFFLRGRPRLQAEARERWFLLCQLAAVEQDPTKMLALVTEINDLLEAKEDRLKRKREADPYTRDPKPE